MPFSRAALAASLLFAAFPIADAAGAVSIPVADETPSLIGADDTEAIRAIAEGYGEARIVELDNGDPEIVGDINGTTYQLFFLDCTEGKACEALNFYAVWDVQTVAVGTINLWNRTAPLNKAYLTEENRPVIEMSLPLAGGIAPDQLKYVLDQWTIALAEFPRSVVYPEE